MRLVTSTLALATLLSPSSAAPAPQTTVTPGAPTPWNVTNSLLGCSLASYTYNFNISGPLTSGVRPAFNTFCSGFDLRNKMVPCAKPEILENLVSMTDQGMVLQVNSREAEE